MIWKIKAEQAFIFLKILLQIEKKNGLYKRKIKLHNVYMFAIFFWHYSSKNIIKDGDAYAKE